MAKAPGILSGVSLHLSSWFLLKPTQFSTDILPLMLPSPLIYLAWFLQSPVPPRTTPGQGEVLETSAFWRTEPEVVPCPLPGSSQ